MIIGNKSDLEEDRIIQREDALNWCKVNNNHPYYETSARDDVNVKEAFDTINSIAANYVHEDLGYT